jgi:phenylacetate-coenzyme A ligase PaaK-like adenylate-forming protein
MIPKTPLESWISRKIGAVTQSRGLTEETLREYQLNKLKETISYARKKSPFYLRQLAGFSEDGPSDLRDLSQLPFTTADHIRADPWHFLAVSQDEIARIVTLQTSGTTGSPKRLFFTNSDLELTLDFFHHGMSTLVKPGQKVLILLPGDKPDSVGDLLARGLRRMNVEGVIHGPVKDAQAAVEKIRSLSIDCLVGIPTQVLALARSKSGSAIEKGLIKSILLSTDYVPKAIVNELGRVWDCLVFNHYGMTEMGLGGGVECEARAGYHLREADLYFEVVDPATGAPLKEGEIGEVVFTTLTREGMPLIRYRTGDISCFLSEPCPCGSTLRRMEPVKGRWDGRVLLDHRSVLMLPEMDEALFPLPGLLNYNVTITNKDGKDCIEIVVCTEQESDQGAHEILRALKTIQAVRNGLARGNLELAPVRFSKENWFTTGVAKRKIVDNRIAKTVS